MSPLWGDEKGVDGVCVLQRQIQSLLSCCVSGGMLHPLTSKFHETRSIWGFSGCSMKSVGARKCLWAELLRLAIQVVQKL